MQPRMEHALTLPEAMGDSGAPAFLHRSPHGVVQDSAHLVAIEREQQVVEDAMPADLALEPTESCSLMTMIGSLGSTRLRQGM